MRYDPTRRALYKPESGEALPDFSSAWPVEWVCAELSRLAYFRFEEGDGPRLERALVRAGFSAPKGFNAPATGAQAIGTLDPDGTAFIAFRGTQPGDPLDPRTNSRFRLVEGPQGGRVHEGFLAAFNSLKGEIDDWLGQKGIETLVATGHSLGAAMATLLASARPDSELVTFGSPRIGDADFAATFVGRGVRRYVDCTDKVTMVPPELIGYRHLAGEIYFDRHGLAHDPPPPPDEIAADRAAGRRHYLMKHSWRLWRNALVRDMADHAPVNYVSATLRRREPD